VDKLPDSLLSVFKTKGGRSVYNGSGIYPDFDVKPFEFHEITQVLVTKYLIFDYATEFVGKHPSIASPDKFMLSDAEYQDFVNYLGKKDYNYQTATEKSLVDLKFDAENDKKWEVIKTDFENLKNKIATSKEADLVTYKPEIKRVLEGEIAQRYYFDKGRTTQSFQYDVELKKAMELLANKSLMATVLNGEGTYNTIGQPKVVNAQAE
jgi:carboxyl-terminal processing protease